MSIADVATLIIVDPIMSAIAGWQIEELAHFSTIFQGFILGVTAILAYTLYRTTANAERTSFYANRLSDTYDLFTREWKDKQLSSPVIFYRRYNPLRAIDEVLDEDAGKRAYELQEARHQIELQAMATRPFRLGVVGGERFATGVSRDPQANEDRIERIALNTRVMIRQQIRRRYKFARLGFWDKSNDLGPAEFNNDSQGPTLAQLRASMDAFWKTAQTPGRWEKDAAYILSLGLQDLGAYVRVGAIPLNHVCMNGARLIIEEWVYCMGRVYGDFRRGAGNISFNGEEPDIFIGATRRHAEWLACAAAIYWTRVYRSGYLNYFILEFEAELARQAAVRAALKRKPKDSEGAAAAGRAARNIRVEQAGKQPGGFLNAVGPIPHIRERERLLRRIDKFTLDRDVSKAVKNEIKRVLDGSRTRKRAPTN